MGSLLLTPSAPCSLISSSRASRPSGHYNMLHSSSRDPKHITDAKLMTPPRQSVSVCVVSSCERDAAHLRAAKVEKWSDDMAPRNATVNGDGFRVYVWPGGDTDLNLRYGATEAQDLLSVTSIRSLAGMPFQLVNWQVSNVVNLAMGSRKATVIGPRGGVSEKFVGDGAFPGEFVKRMQAVTTQKERDELRRWLRSTADEPRDIAAVRGSVVHKLIEDRLPTNVIDQAVIYNRMAKQWADEKKRTTPIAITEQDYNFVWNALLQFEDFRTNVPFVIIAQEPQVYNLRAGYGGSADVLMWFLGEWTRRDDDVLFVPIEGVDHDGLQRRADQKRITIEDIKEIGGQITVGDWKTSKTVYTEHVVQTTAYMAAEFIAQDGIIDERLTAILAEALLGMVIQVRPDKWEVDLFEMRQDVMRAFFGSVAFARFLAFHKKPDRLLSYRIEGHAPDTERSTYVDDD